MIDDPVIACKDFDQENAALDFTGLEFIQIDDDEFIMNGSFNIRRDVIYLLLQICSANETSMTKA